MADQKAGNVTCHVCLAVQTATTLCAEISSRRPNMVHSNHQVIVIASPEPQKGQPVSLVDSREGEQQKGPQLVDSREGEEEITSVTLFTGTDV